MDSNARPRDLQESRKRVGWVKSDVRKSDGNIEPSIESAVGVAVRDVAKDGSFLVKEMF